MRTEDHHLIGGYNRTYADSDGLYIPICDNCHTLDGKALHRSSVSEHLSKMLGQAIWERNELLKRVYVDYSDQELERLHDDFRKRYGKSWL